jgi:hypothetical protein
MSNIGVADVATVYDDNINTATEPELRLLEETKKNVAAKIQAETAKSDLLQAGIDTDVMADGNKNTMISGIPTKDGHNTVVTLPEYVLDNKLRAKKRAIDNDLLRLRAKYLSLIDANIVDTITRQKEITGYDSLINAAARTTRSYLAGLKTTRRRKRSGRKGAESGPVLK